MGKGDRKTRRGKIWHNSHGKYRPRTSSASGEYTSTQVSKVAASKPKKKAATTTTRTRKKTAAKAS